MLVLTTVFKGCVALVSCYGRLILHAEMLGCSKAASDTAGGGWNFILIFRNDLP